MKDVNGLGDFLAWLGGADLRIVAQAPGYERTRFIQMAIVLLTTSGIGTLSMTFALHYGVGTSLVVAIIGGLAWGFVILNLDRFLVLSMGHTRDWKRLLLMALPRLGLAAVISIVVATPMTLRIFANDIKNEMVQINATESKQVAAQQLQSGPATQAAKILGEINTDKQTLQGHLQGTNGSPGETFWQGQVNTLTPQVNQAQTAMDNAQAAYQCELYGSGPNCAGASDRQGYGPLAKLKRTEFEQDQADYESLSSKLHSAQQQLSSAQSTAEKESGQTLHQQEVAAKAALPGLEKHYSTLEAELSRNEAQAQAAVQGNTGLLAQLQDLSAVGAKNPTLRAAQWIVTLLFFCIEILPVLVKVLLNSGSLTTYEVLLKNEEDMIADRAKFTRVTSRRDAEKEADKQIAIDEDMRQREEKLGKKANEHVAQHMEALLDLALAEWSRQVQARLGVQMPPRIPVLNSTGGTNGSGANGSGTNGSGTSGSGTSGSGTSGSGTSGSGTSGSGASGTNGSGQAPIITYLTPPGSGYSLPDDDGDLL